MVIRGKQLVVFPDLIRAHPTGQMRMFRQEIGHGSGHVWRVGNTKRGQDKSSVLGVVPQLPQHGLKLGVASADKLSRYVPLLHTLAVVEFRDCHWVLRPIVAFIPSRGKGFGNQEQIAGQPPGMPEHPMSIRLCAGKDRGERRPRQSALGLVIRKHRRFLGEGGQVRSNTRLVVRLKVVLVQGTSCVQEHKTRHRGAIVLGCAGTGGTKNHQSRQQGHNSIHPASSRGPF